MSTETEKQPEPDLTPEELRIWIAERCGWRIENYGTPEYPTLYWRLRRPDGTIRCADYTGEEWSRRQFSWMVPGYLNDLQAMHGAEELLTEQQAADYSLHLIRLAVSPEDVDFAAQRFTWHATAAQRARAFYLAAK